MHYGTVNDGIEAIVTLTALGNNDATERIAFIIDTGLTEEAILPQEIIDRLNLPAVDGDDNDDSFRITLADGSTAIPSVYTTRILWHDRLREVQVVALGPDPLIGMGLLRGCNINVDAVPGGLVTITELSVPS